MTESSWTPAVRHPRNTPVSLFNAVGLLLPSLWTRSDPWSTGLCLTTPHRGRDYSSRHKLPNHDLHIIRDPLRTNEPVTGAGDNTVIYVPVV